MSFRNGRARAPFRREVRDSQGESELSRAAGRRPVLRLVRTCGLAWRGGAYDRMQRQRSAKAFIFRCSITRERPSAFAACDTLPLCWRSTSAM